MGAEAGLTSSLTPKKQNYKDAPVHPPEVLGLQLSALVDHLAPVDWSLLEQLKGDKGGSQQVSIEELNNIISKIKTQILAIAGGSVANTIRGLKVGFKVSCGIIGACGDDDQGRLFIDNMGFNGVDLSRLRTKKGHTAQCVCLVDENGNRTMRPCLSTAVKLQANEFRREDFKGSKWLVVRYAHQNLEIIKAAIKIAKQEDVSISLDLASFEMVRDYRTQLVELLETGNIDLCFANEDEARELIRGDENSDLELALNFLASHCKWAVVTLASKGCIAKHNKEVVRVAAISQANPVDATGAGDLFASGFLYGLISNLPLKDCCELGACSGGSVIRALGGEVRPENWQWMYKQLKAKGMDLVL